MNTNRLKAPFPYYGGKAKFADDVWDNFGVVERYVEPFAGTLAVLLANPNPAPMEIVCDLNGYICNFWRAVRSDPEQTAYYADYPTIHHDLTARHIWLKKWGADSSNRLSQDPEWFDAKAAGWWVWGMSLWIGGEWCDLNQSGNVESRPFVQKSGNGQGVRNVAGRPYVSNKGRHGRGISAQVGDRRPNVSVKNSGAGVSNQRDQIPQIHLWTGGSGVSMQAVSDKRPSIKTSGGGGGVSKQTSSNRLSSWFNDLRNRLERVIILNRDWTSAVTPTVLADTPTSPIKSRAIFLDPPYRTGGRNTSLYQSDTAGTSEETAIKTYEWAIKHGKLENYRIAYCCGEDDFPIPADWTSIAAKYSGVRATGRTERKEIIMFSPHCHIEETLFSSTNRENR